MWVYKFADKETRNQVPTLNTFLRGNQDTIKMWLENTTETVAWRVHFSLRLLHWLVSVCILFLTVYALVDPKGSYYQE